MAVKAYSLRTRKRVLFEVCECFGESLVYIVELGINHAKFLFFSPLRGVFLQKGKGQKGQIPIRICLEILDYACLQH